MGARNRKFDPDWVDLESVANVLGEDIAGDLVCALNEAIAGEFELIDGPLNMIRVSRERLDREIVETVEMWRQITQAAAA